MRILISILLLSTAAGAGERAEDTRSIQSTVAALYACISGPAGAARDWDRFKSLFIPEAHLVFSGKKDGAALHTAMTPAEFAAHSQPYFAREGFYESALASKVDQFGNVAQVFSTYESRFETGGKPFARGINSIQLLFDGKRWWVVSLIWDSERPDNAIPAKYLK